MIFIIYLIIGVVFGYIGAKMAGARGRDPALWGLLCFLFPLLGVLALALAGKRNDQIVVSLAAPAASVPAKSFDTQKWEVLVGVDNDISDAVKSLSLYGQRYIDELAEKYLALNRQGLFATTCCKYSEIGIG